MKIKWIPVIKITHYQTRHLLGSQRNAQIKRIWIRQKSNGDWVSQSWPLLNTEHILPENFNGNLPFSYVDEAEDKEDNVLDITFLPYDDAWNTCFCDTLESWEKWLEEQHIGDDHENQMDSGSSNNPLSTTIKLA